MKKLKSKLSNLCYFKKIGIHERNKLLGEFETEAERTSVNEAYEECRAHVLVSYKNDSFKIFLFILSCAITFCSLMAPILFITGASWGYGIFTYLNYTLYAVLFASLIYGVFSRKISLRAYKYHGMLLAVQLLITLGGIIFVMYKFAEGLSAF